MTTLRRALPGLYKKGPILTLAALTTCALLAMLFAGQPALAMSHGGGGGGGHSGGGGGHASSGHSGGGHMTSGHGFSHGPGGGTAHPIGGGGFFGPSRGFHGGFGGGFRGGFGGGFHDGRFFGGGFYPWFGFGLGLGLGFGWDYPWGWYPGPYGYWGPYWSGYNPGYGYYPGYGYDGYGYDGYGNDGYSPGYGSGGSGGSSSPRPNDTRSQRAPMGALDLDISPSDAQVYLNGEYIGRVRDFGGWHRGYLWLEKGTYDIVFYKEGFRTLARQVSIYPGLVITWDDKLEPGQAVKPEDLPSKSHERRDSRLQFERDRAEQIDRQQQAQQPPQYQPQPPPQPPQSEDDQGQYGGGWRDNWHDRVNRDRAGDPTPQRNVQPAPAPGPSRAAVTSDQYGRLRVKVEPDDASVYLDGRFVGTGSDLAGNEAGLLLAPGHHRLSVVRPGHRAEERDIDAVLGKDVDLKVTLAASGPTSK
ncbi:MAG TPA: PEGA domain-containing protein [Thermoanaerobaculia bacterium]|nr:PEGA domain-containing protein [Thermoanaerobaculia bacterium]